MLTNCMQICQFRNKCNWLEYKSAHIQTQGLIWAHIITETFRGYNCGGVSWIYLPFKMSPSVQTCRGRLAGMDQESSAMLMNRYKSENECDIFKRTGEGRKFWLSSTERFHLPDRRLNNWKMNGFETCSQVVLLYILVTLYFRSSINLMARRSAVTQSFFCMLFNRPLANTFFLIDSIVLSPLFSIYIFVTPF